MATAYVGAISGRYYLIAAVLALARTALTIVTFLIWRRQSEAACSSALALTELQGRLGARLNMESVRVARVQPTRARARQIAPVTLGGALVLDFAAHWCG